jgi:hypothetical protein
MAVRGLLVVSSERQKTSFPNLSSHSHLRHSFSDNDSACISCPDAASFLMQKSIFSITQPLHGLSTNEPYIPSATITHISRQWNEKESRTKLATKRRCNLSPNVLSFSNHMNSVIRSLCVCVFVFLRGETEANAA